MANIERLMAAFVSRPPAVGVSMLMDPSEPGIKEFPTSRKNLLT